MATWGVKKQVLYLSIAGAVFFIAIAIPIYLKFFNKPPTCFDGIQNQDERATDCGGICARLCEDESKNPITLFQRIFEIAPGTYSLLAIVENNNQGVYSREAKYVFRTYDKDNVLLDERFGSTFISPNKSFPILEHSIFTGERKPQKTVFSFLYPLNWEKGNFLEPRFEVVNVFATSTDTTPRIEAQIKNSEVYSVKNIKIIAVVYDENNNAFATSQTVIDFLAAKGKANTVFTWNMPFKGSIGKIDIIARAYPRDI